jgi:putative membrane protein
VFVRFLIGWALLAVAFGITSWLLDGMEVSGGVWGYIWVSALFGIVNAFIGTILRLFTFPLILLTLGLFAVLINALLLQITDALSSHLTIDEFWWTAIWAAIILAFVSVVLSVAVRALVWHERPAVT